MKISKGLALEIADFYASGSYTMEEIARRYNLTNHTNIFSSKVISKCIYFAIFYQLVPESIERLIIFKINNNKAAHMNIPEYVPIKNTKYESLIRDREAYKNAKDDYSQLMYFLYPFIEKDILMEKIKFQEESDICDYISSEDEPFYVPPEDIEYLQDQLNYIDFLISKRQKRYEEAIKKKAELEKEISTLENKYSI